MPLTTKFVLISALIIVTMSAGYIARRRNWASERLGQRLMTIVVVVGYTLAGILSVWPLRLTTADALLPAIAALHVIILTLLALAYAPVLSAGPPDRATFALAAGFGNNGFTMGAFIAYVLFGQQALGLTSVYLLMAMPVTVLFFYPIARHHSDERSKISLTRLMLQSVYDWRSIGLPAVLLAVILSPTVLDVPRPACVTSPLLLDGLMFLITAVAYFAIGLRLHLAHVPRMARMIVSLGIFRFLIGPAVSLALLLLLTPWAPSHLAFKTFLVVSTVPTAVSAVALANMFALRPREASALFVANTLTYLLLILPFVVWYYR